MQIEQIYTGCLAQGAYYITSNNEAIIIDPLRETQPYIERLKKDKVQLKYIFETHFHADFVSGHLDLSKATEAKIVYGPTAQPGFEAIIASDNQTFTVGNITIKALHTPGHTLESTSYLLYDENGVEKAIFSGDTLFIGDVGRPDLAQKAANMTQEQLATVLYHSLRNKIMVLPDHVVVYPAHGAGSACGKNMSKETYSTLGEQKRTNYALRANMTENEFIKEVLEGLTPPPSYFRMNVSMNKLGYTPFSNVLEKGMLPLTVTAFEEIKRNNEALIIDTRPASDFCTNHIPGSVNIGIKGDFAPWVGTVIQNVEKPLLLVTQPGYEQETITRLSRVGFDNILGYLNGGIETWNNANKETATINRISAQQFAQQLNQTTDVVIDIRKETEFKAQHLNHAINKPLAYINEWIKEIDPTKPFYIHCAGGYRSMIAASILKANGITQFTEIEGGFNAIAKTDLLKTSFLCTNAT